MSDDPEIPDTPPEPDGVEPETEDQPMGAPPELDPDDAPSPGFPEEEAPDAG